ncbi:Membrane protein [Gulosibacter sp. 10]|nr:Membrane protein [Gulosibacter sp. 10]
MLEEMERSLYQNDADVVSTTPKSGGGISAKAITIIVLSIVLGVAVVVAGIAFRVPWLGLVGFVLMIAGIMWAIRGNGGGGEESVSAGPTPASGGKGAGRKPAKSGGSFMGRLEDRWERRQDGDL